MKRAKIIILTLFFLFPIGIGVLHAQQDIQFSQYIFNGLSLNPGYAGYKEELNLNTTYRTQWTGLTGAPTTITASIDGTVRENSIGLGFSVLQDKLGPQSTLSALGSIAYRLKVSDLAKLSFGVSAGMDQYQIDNSQLNPITPEPGLSGIQSSVIRPDLQFGLFFASEHYFVGVSGLDLLASFSNSNPGYFVIRRNRHFYFHAGAVYSLNESLSIKPSFLIKEDFKSPANLDINTFLIWHNKIWLGASIRSGLSIFQSSSLQAGLQSADAASIMVEYFPNRNLRIGYSFDYTTSHLQQVSAGSHEISLGYVFRGKRYSMLSPRLF